MMTMITNTDDNKKIDSHWLLCYMGGRPISCSTLLYSLSGLASSSASESHLHKSKQDGQKGSSMSTLQLLCV